VIRPLEKWLRADIPADTILTRRRSSYFDEPRHRPCDATNDTQRKSLGQINLTEKENEREGSYRRESVISQGRRTQSNSRIGWQSQPLFSFRIAFTKLRYFFPRSKIAEARNARSGKSRELLDSVDNMVRARTSERESNAGDPRGT